jgi:hypothetical protein
MQGGFSVSVLTKVLFVLLTVSSIALSMLVVGSFSQQQNWKQSADDWQQTAIAAQAKERVAVSNAAVEQQRMLAQSKSDSAKIAQLQASLDANETKLADLDRKLADASNKLSVEQGQVTSIGDENKIILATLNREKEFSAKLAKRNSELERGNIDLTDHVKELTTSVEMCSSQNRALQQQIVAREEGAGSGGGLSPSAQIPGGTGIVEPGYPTVQPSGTSSSAVPIRGQVTSVKGSLASISVGSADGVAPGMSFLIYRRGGGGAKPQYLGTLKITRVDVNQSAGSIEQSEGDIQAGDSARDEASFAMRG